MTDSLAKYNTNSPDTDFINLGTIKVNLNNLDLARIVDGNGYKYGILFMKNGASYVVEEEIVNKLSDYCR